MFTIKKKYFLCIIIYVLPWNCLFGEIKNGYGSEIKSMRESLKGLNALLTNNSHLSLFQKIEIKNKIDKLVEYIAYFELTNELLNQFRAISPDQYNEIDSITDRTGHKVDVFVKFVPEQEMYRGAAGTTNLAHSENDRNVYQSEYGRYTVSVKIASVKRALLLLAHEFGHVKYQVPNLASYVEYYSTYYQNCTFNSNYIGHYTNDRSGQKAVENENQFREQYLNFLKIPNVKVGNPLALLVEIRKKSSKS